jgi:glyoxylase I family protein
MQLHHAVLFAADADRSLRFYRDGLGLDLLVDREFDGDWPTLLGVSSTRLRAVILGDRDQPHAGQVELLTMVEPVPIGGGAAPPVTGTVVLSFHVDLAATLAQLEAVGVTDVQRITLQRGNQVASVRDPDEVLVELIDIGRPKSDSS